MNEKQLLILRNNHARLLDPHSKRERNAVRINTGNTLAHELAKFYLNWVLRKEGYETVTEAIFKKRIGRADIFDLDNGTVCEILKSETAEHFYDKKEYYPRGVTLVAYKSDELLAKLLKELGEKK